MVQESDKNAPKQHTLRPADPTVTPLTTQETKYWGRIASRTTSILKTKIQKGELKRSGHKRGGHVNKIAIFMVILIITFSGVIVWAQFQGQITATTTLRSPINVSSTSFQMPDIWLNKTGNWIQPGVFTINTGNKPLTYTFLVFATAHVNGSDTQNMAPLFSKFTVVISDGVRNVTSPISLIGASQPTAFSYQNGSDQSFQFIISYASKPVQLGASSQPLTISFLFNYSGQ